MSPRLIQTNGYQSHRAQTITCEEIAGLCDPSDSRRVARRIPCDAADYRGDSNDELSHSYESNGAEKFETSARMVAAGVWCSTKFSCSLCKFTQTHQLAR